MESCNHVLTSLTTVNNPIYQPQPMDKTKALFRQGQALVKLGRLDEATNVLNEACVLSPEDKLIQRELAVVKKVQLEKERKEKAMYQRMFN